MMDQLLERDSALDPALPAVNLQVGNTSFSEIMRKKIRIKKVLFDVLPSKKQKFNVLRKL